MSIEPSLASSSADKVTDQLDDSSRDRPLSGSPHPHDKLHPRLYAAEMFGTLVLVVCGLSLVIALWGKGGPFSEAPLSPGGRRLLNGFLFGCVGAAVAYSPVGKVSGGHINPAVTFAFWLDGKLQWRDATCYVVAQLIGASLGGVMLLTWGDVGASAGWGAARPADGVPLVLALGGESFCTFALVVLIFAFAARPRVRQFTPLVNPPLFAVLTWLEAPLSGASANPARSFAPELVGWAWSGWWVYWVGPMAGATVAMAMMRTSMFGLCRPEAARLCHFAGDQRSPERRAAQV